jgi:hypothetical protein
MRSKADAGHGSIAPPSGGMDATARVHRGAWRSGVAGKRNPTVGMLSTTSEGAAGFQQGLSDFGYVVGQNISLVRKDIEGNLNRLDQLVAELVAINPDVIFGGGSQTTFALKRQTSTIPIVTLSTNPLGLGFVASLADPEGT